MIRPDQIPDEAVEFIARALCVAEGHDPERLRLKGSSKLWTIWSDEARAAIVATINAWETPKHKAVIGLAFDELSGDYRALILPLTQEKTDDEG